MVDRPAAFAIKVAIDDLSAKTFTFSAQKTMYAGKTIAAGDRIFIFASENDKGHGLFACGTVTKAKAVARTAAARQTPRVSITVTRTGIAKRPLGRQELHSFHTWEDEKPETELNFKFYRQATDKIVGITPKTAAFLETFFS